ncbi:hypothetical protein BC827DRAFT_1233887 [Russula dissimulans]|nr:hypothetical protein BC827DRAFT_1233887 [Russula dissimulans]
MAIELKTSDSEHPHSHLEPRPLYLLSPLHMPSIHQPRPYSFRPILIVLPCRPSTPFIALKTDRAPKTRSSPKTPLDPLLGQQQAAISLEPTVPQNP